LRIAVTRTSFPISLFVPWSAWRRCRSCFAASAAQSTKRRKKTQEQKANTFLRYQNLRRRRQSKARVRRVRRIGRPPPEKQGTIAIVPIDTGDRHMPFAREAGRSADRVREADRGGRDHLHSVLRGRR
jgi:hypothetical protein